MREVCVEGEGQAGVRQVIGLRLHLSSVLAAAPTTLLVLDHIELAVAAPLPKAKDLREVLEYACVVI